MGSKTVAIIGARLSSKRLPGKQLLPLAGKPLISHIVTRLRQVEQIGEIIVATTNEPVNQPLCDWADAEAVTAFAWDGDQNDVVGRVDAAFKASGAQHFVYVCGDCPFIEPTTIEKLISVSKQVSQAGLVGLAPPKNGGAHIHEGFDVYNDVFWSQMVAVAHEPFEREHIGAVYHHLKKLEPAELLFVQEDAIFAEVQHRLSVDTQQDYAFATILYHRWYAQNDASTIVDLRWVIEQLKADKKLVSLNAHVHQKSVKEIVPVIKILCEAGPGIGLGHLSRACVAAQSLLEHAAADVELLIKGEETAFEALNLLRHRWVKEFDVDFRDADSLVVDVKSIDENLANSLRASAGGSYRVGVDIFEDAAGLFDLLWGPSVYANERELDSDVLQKLQYGPDCFLLRKPLAIERREESSQEKSLIVLTGGADPAKLSKFLPELLDNQLPSGVRIDWVKGPYAEEPLLPSKLERFKVLDAPTDLHQRIANYDLALCVFGVSFFECLNAGTPVVTFDPIGAATDEEWRELKLLAPTLIADSFEDAVDRTKALLSSSDKIELPEVASKLALGPENFAKAVSQGILQCRETPDAAA